MLFEKLNVDRIFQFLFFIICIFYIGFYMPYGFEGTDTGYIFGTSWNIYNGELPHRDYIYTRPAIPAFFHTVFLFISETYGYLLDRGFFYIQIFFYSFLGAKLLVEQFTLSSKALLFFLATVGAIISIHSYPPMGWNTIDGVFFCMIGMYLLIKKDTSIVQLCAGAFFLVLGVFSKQSFYFMPIFIFLYFLFKKDFYKLKYYTIFGIIMVLLYASFKYFTNSLFPFIDQTFLRTPASALVNSGIKNYYLALKFNLIPVVISIVTIWVAFKYLPKKYAFGIFNVLIAGYAIWAFHQEDGFTVFKNYIIQLLFMASAGFALYKSIRDKRYYLLLLLLCLSWSASISNGYKTPIHFSLPIFFSIYIFFFNSEEKKFPVAISGGIIAFYLIAFYFGYQSIYRESNRNQLTYNMGEVYPQLSFIKSDKDTFEKYKEFKNLAAKYPNFTVLPSMTLAHYLTGTVNPIGIDWPLDVEINNEATQLEAQLREKKSIVLMENSEFSEKELEGYQLVDIIEKDWAILEKTNYFTVYSSEK